MIPLLNRHQFLSENEYSASYKELFNSVLPPTFHTCIVGGGIAGLLLALKNPPSPETPTLVLDMSPTLGGRLNFTPPQHSGKTPWDRFLFALEQPQPGGGWGFDVLPSDTSATYMRHILQYLKDDEVDFWHNWCKDTASFESPKTFFLKKELIEPNHLLTTPSEFFTKKEAVWLANAMESQANGYEGPFSQWPEWKQFTPSQKNVYVPILESIFGTGYPDMLTSRVFQVLKSTFYPAADPLTPLMAKAAQPELAWEIILRRRGIHLGLGYKVENIAWDSNSRKWSVESTSKGSSYSFGCDNVVCSNPLGRSFGFISRDFLKPNQSKWASKLRPLSIVAIEYNPCKSSFLSPYLAYAAPGSLVVIPSHKCMGSVTSTGSFILWCWIDFEDSLNAPSVKEKVIQLRRAAQKIFQPESFPKKHVFYEKEQGKFLMERVVLLPVGKGLPWMGPNQGQLTEVALAKPGLYAVGDGFHLGQEPWQSVLGSVDLVAQELKTQRNLAQ